MMRYKSYLVWVVALVLSGCMANQDDLDGYISDVKNRPPTPIDPIPEIETPEVYSYSAGEQGWRTPFIFDDEPTEDIVTNGLKPDEDRPREELEQFSLDTLRMVGTLHQGEYTFALIQNKEGRVFRVRRGNYLGKNHGRVTGVFQDRIELVEIIGDRSGGYVERQTAVALGEQ